MRGVRTVSAAAAGLDRSGGLAVLHPGDPVQRLPELALETFRDGPQSDRLSLELGNAPFGLRISTGYRSTSDPQTASNSLNTSFAD